MAAKQVLIGVLLVLILGLAIGGVVYSMPSSSPVKTAVTPETTVVTPKTLVTSKPPPVVAATTKTSECVWDPVQYSEFYPDLKRHFGTDKNALRAHFADHGIPEGRTPCGAKMPDCKFTQEGYYKANPDIAGHGIPAQQHWREHGHYEDRIICKK